MAKTPAKNKVKPAPKKQVKPKATKPVAKKNYKAPPPKRVKPNSGASPVKSFFRFLFSKWMRRIIMLAVILALLFWQWDNIYEWITVTVTDTIGTLGWGLILIVLAILIILCIIFHQPLGAFIKRYKLHLWNKWLGGAAIFFGVWGILGLLDVGGSFGRSIVSYDTAAGIFRVLGLLLLGIILMAPRACLHGWIKFSMWIAKPFTSPAPSVKPEKPVYQPPLQSTDYYNKKFADRKTVPQPEVLLVKEQSAKAATVSAPQKHEPLVDNIVPPKVLIPPEVNRKKPVAEALVAEAMKNKQEAQTAAAQPTPEKSEKAEKSDIKQVAQDVWRKYGQSASLVMLDGWKLPPIDILDKAIELEYGQADNAIRARKIDEALASYGVDAKVIQINVGPTVTQFEIEPGWDVKTKLVKERDENGNVRERIEEVSRTRVKVDKITSLSNDLALALASPTIRIEAPIPGKSAVGIEVPNSSFGTVSLRSVIESNNFQKLLAKSKLAMALGKGAGGESIAGDLAKMPHLLIAGATGSGKTVCLNAVISCILMCNTPYDTRLIMIDPKRVELVQFNSLPHLATPVIVDTNKAVNALRWLNQEMDLRYQKLAAASARNIEGYNKNKTGKDKMPNIVLIIDELADLMMAGFDEVEHILCRLAQLARAIGIHLVVATQRPSVDVVTGLIKANFPTRISFAVTSQVDSRTILDMVGAEKLLGKGDMLYMPTEEAKPKRLQGCFISDAEIERLVYFWNSQKPEEQGAETPSPLKVEEVVIPDNVNIGKKDEYPKDPLLQEALELAKEHDQISTSFLQRKLHIGYPRAARLMEQLEEELGKVIDDGGAEA
jgi:S-DNA-T family DNA segregation ATPase FtsK/SpoIIIE